jgi:ribonuclease D
MLEYAAQDVLYLPRAYESIRQRLLLSDGDNKLGNISSGIQN